MLLVVLSQRLSEEGHSLVQQKACVCKLAIQTIFDLKNGGTRASSLPTSRYHISHSLTHLLTRAILFFFLILAVNPSRAAARRRARDTGETGSLGQDIGNARATRQARPALTQNRGACARFVNRVEGLLTAGETTKTLNSSNTLTIPPKLPGLHIGSYVTPPRCTGHHLNQRMNE